MPCRAAGRSGRKRISPLSRSEKLAANGIGAQQNAFALGLLPGRRRISTQFLPRRGEFCNSGECVDSGRAGKEIPMRKRSWTVLFLSGFIAAWGCAGGMPAGTQGQKKTPAPPVITQAYAATAVRPGGTWKVYLIAKDPEGEMKYIVATMDQQGIGTTPVSRTRIKPENQKELNGYVYWNVPVGRNLEFTSLTLSLDIQDKAGQHSRSIDFPLSINTFSPQEPPPPGVFQENNLGPIMIRLLPREDREGPPSIFFGPFPR